MIIDPLPTPSSSDAMAFPAVVLATFGLGPCVIALVKLKFARGDQTVAETLAGSGSLYRRLLEPLAIAALGGVN